MEKFAEELELEGITAPAWSFFKRNAAKFLEHGTVENLVSSNLTSHYISPMNAKKKILEISAFHIHSKIHNLIVSPVTFYKNVEIPLTFFLHLKNS